MLASAPAAGGELQVANVCDALAESVDLGPSRQGASGPATLRQGASVPAHGAVATPASGWRLRHVQFAPPPLYFHLRSFSGMAANGKEGCELYMTQAFFFAVATPAIGWRLRPV